MRAILQRQLQMITQSEGFSDHLSEEYNTKSLIHVYLHWQHNILQLYLF